MEISENKSSQFRTGYKLPNTKETVCSVCGKTYSNYISYKRHIKIHFENRSSHECPVCSKTFHEKYILKRHINLTHLGVRKYECAYCGGKYATKDNLVKHIRTLHLTKPELREEAIKCLLCECYFRNRIHLSAHVRKQHKNQGSKENNINEKQKKIKNRNANLPHPDDLLAMTLEQSDVNLVKKPDIHTSEIVMKDGRPHYKCDVCGIIQNKFSSLQRHMVTHEFIKKFKCPSCEVYFKHLSDLRFHMKTRHEIKCKSNNNKMLWNLIKDLKSDMFVKDTKAKNRKKIEKNEKILSKSKEYDNGFKKIQYKENYVHENTHPVEIINELSMPNLDEESVTTIPAAKQTEQMNVTSAMPVEIPLLQHNDRIRNNASDIQSENEQTCSKHNNLLHSTVEEFHKIIIVPERNPTSTMKDALLGQANVPLIEEVTINIPKCNVETYSNIIHDQIDTGNTNDGIIIYPPGDGHLYSECEYLNKNILNVMGLNYINAEPSESFESSQNSNTDLSMAVITDSANIMHENEDINCKLEQIILNNKYTPTNQNYCEPNKKKELEITKIIDHNFEEYFNKHIEESEYMNERVNQVQDINTNVANSSEILYDQNCFKIAPKTPIKHVEDFENYNILVRCNNAEKADHITQMQNGSTLTLTSGFNADIDLNQYNIDVAFDLNELSMESNNANISLTDIVEGMYSQSEGPENTVSIGEHFLQTSEEKQITLESRNIENDTTAQIVSPSDFLIDTIIPNFNTLNYDADIIKETQNNNRTFTTPTEIQYHVQDMSSIDIEKYFQANTKKSPEINSIAMPSFCNPGTNTSEKTVLSVNGDIIENPDIIYSNCVDVEGPIDLFYGNSITDNNSNRKFVSHENNDEMYADVDEVSFSPIREIRTPNSSNNLGVNESFKHSNVIEQSESDVPDTTVRNINDIGENVNLIEKPKNKIIESLNDLEFLEDTNCIESIKKTEHKEQNVLQNYSTVLYDTGQTDDNFGMSESDFKLAFNPKLIESNNNIPNNRCDITDIMQPTLQGNIDNSPALLAKRTMARYKHNQDITKESSKSNCASHPDAFDRVLKSLMCMPSRHEHKCDECPASFQRLRDLRRHDITHNPKLKYLCEVCGKCLSSKTYDDHLKQHNSEKMICWVCGVLLSEVSFARHKCVSTYKYECPLCDKKFNYGIAKKNHLLTHFKQGILQ